MILNRLLVALLAVAAGVTGKRVVKPSRCDPCQDCACNGPRGDRGETGPHGEQGAQGYPGASGMSGFDGIVTGGNLFYGTSDFQYDSGIFGVTLPYLFTSAQIYGDAFAFDPNNNAFIAILKTGVYQIYYGAIPNINTEIFISLDGNPVSALNNTQFGLDGTDDYFSNLYGQAILPINAGQLLTFMFRCSSFVGYGEFSPFLPYITIFQLA